MTIKSALIRALCTYRLLWIVQKKLESAHREAQVLEIKRQGQMKALEAQRAKKEVGLCLLASLLYIACTDLTALYGCCCWTRTPPMHLGHSYPCLMFFQSLTDSPR